MTLPRPNTIRGGGCHVVGWLLAGTMAASQGCAAHRGAGPPASPSTLEHNLRTLPRGRMIGPPGLGVDLAGGVPGATPRPKIDPEARPVQAAGPDAAPPQAPPAVTAPAATAEVPIPAPVAPQPPPAQPPEAVPAPAATYPIDLTSALRLAEVENPNIGEARARIGEALAIQQQARVLLLPTLNAGGNYHGHVGDLQRSSGRILSLSEQSLYLGGGSRTLAAESLAFPAVRIFTPITDAIFEPLAARQRVNGAGYTAIATANSVLLEVATLYLELQGAEARLEAVRRTADEASAVAGLTISYASVGQKPKADADRSRTELSLFQVQVQKAQEEVAVASARLVRRLHLDPNVRLRADDAPLEPISLVDPSRRVEDLVQEAIRRRPEMAAAVAAIEEAEVRLREEQARPLLPTLSLGYSGGGFGGGSNLVTPYLGHFGGRTDADVWAFWTLQNFGLGNLAIQKNRRAAIGQAEAEQAKAANLVRREVAQAVALSAARAREIEVIRAELASAEAGYQEDLTRARGAVGRPIEVLDSLKLLNRARQKLIRALVGYDQAQFSLFVALGSPPPLAGPVGPLPPAPVASPPLPAPLASGPHAPGPRAPDDGRVELTSAKARP